MYERRRADRVPQRGGWHVPLTPRGVDEDEVEDYLEELAEQLPPK